MGCMFINLQDETGLANAVVQPQLFEKNRFLISEETFLQFKASFKTTTMSFM